MTAFAIAENNDWSIFAVSILVPAVKYLFGYIPYLLALVGMNSNGARTVSIIQLA